MDDKIVDILGKLLDEKLKPVIDSQTRLEKKLDSVIDQTVALTEFRTEMKEFRNEVNSQLEYIKDDLSNVEVITASNWKDIARLKAVK